MEREKQRHLKGQTISHIKQVPGWSERLASDSEAVVKAEHECPDCPMEEMQQQTIETLKARGQMHACMSCTVAPGGPRCAFRSAAEEEADATSFGGNAPPSGALGNA
ncbi:hypothetical protein COHA_007245 [Chlorella ohadii]|uniref:Uncharacterized protein n=1 Tax=Chlorella ohadii TaxID=2649997 RepID=A0AAD5DJ79_9CHLO|nr:hypothetical protein COHA_007245 [Chlorella ohadii]